MSVRKTARETARKTARKTALSAQKIIEYFQMQPLEGEGGLFVQTYQASEVIPRAALPKRYQQDKTFGTAILYLLTSEPDSFSALHKLPTDEVYHFYLGDPLEMLLLYPDCSSQKIILGQDLMAGQQVQFVVPRGVWQGSFLLPGGKFALLGTTMAPGFDPTDFLSAKRQDLLDAYPQEETLIRKLTR